MLKARIAVLVSGGGTNLGALIEAQKSGIIQSGKIVLVISSNPDAYALTRAKNAGIDAITVSGKLLGSQSEAEKQIADLLDKYKIDLIILAGYLSILSGDFTCRYPDRIINIHPALIPSFCGKGCFGIHVHEAVLARGVKLTGATVHYVNEIPDGGKIIAQKAVEVLDGDTPETLQRRVMEQAEWIILPQATELVSKKIIGGKQ